MSLQIHCLGCKAIQAMQKSSWLCDGSHDKKNRAVVDGRVFNSSNNAFLEEKNLQGIFFKKTIWK
jgi:hypothetical protein